MMGPSPVSAVVPVRNGERYLAAALDSILSQSCCPAEIIVVDDGSTDDTVVVAGHYASRVTLIRQSNQGPGAARNAGAARASGTLVAFLDADDVWTPGALASHLAALESSPVAVAAWGLSSLAVALGGKPPPEDWGGRPQWALSVSSMMFHRSVLAEFGGFAAEMRYGEDLDLLVRLREAGLRMAHHDYLVAERRLHTGNLTRDEVLTERARFVAVKRAYDRRRACRTTGANS